MQSQVEVLRPPIEILHSWSSVSRTDVYSESVALTLLIWNCRPRKNNVWVGGMKGV